MAERPDSSGEDSPAAAAIAAVLRPLARLAVARGIGYSSLQRALKAALVDAARRADPQASQSRISLMSGVHRKDVRALLADGMPSGEPPRPSVAQTVMARWLARAAPGDAAPPTLARGGADGFDALVAEVSRDVRPRAVLDEMRRLGLVVPEGGAPDDPAVRVRLTGGAHVPGSPAGDGDAGEEDRDRLDLFAGNVADHVATAVDNLEAPPGAPRRLERAVFHTHLSAESVAALEAEARRLGMDALIALNRQALEHQRRDLAAGTATRRFRYGVYFHESPLDPSGGGDGPAAETAQEDGPDNGEGEAER